MNHKGHIGSMMMALGASILVIYALMVMVNFERNISKESLELSILSEINKLNHESNIDNLRTIIFQAIINSKETDNFEELFNESLKSLADSQRTKSQNTNLYAKLALGDYSLTFDGTNYILIIKDIFQETTRAMNEIKYSYSLSISFNKEGIITITYL